MLRQNTRTKKKLKYDNFKVLEISETDILLAIEILRSKVWWKEINGSWSGNYLSTWFLTFRTLNRNSKHKPAILYHFSERKPSRPTSQEEADNAVVFNAARKIKTILYRTCYILKASRKIWKPFSCCFNLYGSAIMLQT